MNQDLDFSKFIISSPYWNKISQDDQTELIRLRNQLHQKVTKNSRLISFSDDLTKILEYIEHDDIGREWRCILIGIAFAGSYICVNTRQLKTFLGRCKSSINELLQHLGYFSVKEKTKTKTYVLSIIPYLINDRGLLRQWSVRFATNESPICFFPKFRPRPVPLLKEDELKEEHSNKEENNHKEEQNHTEIISKSNAKNTILYQIHTSSIHEPNLMSLTETIIDQTQDNLPYFGQFIPDENQQTKPRYLNVIFEL